MSETIDSIQERLAWLARDHKRELELAYDRGFNDGIGIKLPTEAEFDSKHVEPQPYGEEDDWVVVSANLYSEDKALAKIRKYCAKEFGWSDDELPTDVSKWGIGYKRYEGEPCYYLDVHEHGRWPVWGVATQ